MDLKERIYAFSQLGKLLNKDFFNLHKEEMYSASVNNNWFTIRNIKIALESWSKSLTDEMLSSWLEPYKLNDSKDVSNVLVIMAGNIPLVGFHDLLAVLISGNHIIIKMSSNDNIILPAILNELILIDSRFKQRISYIEEIENIKFDAVIATGNNNSAQYFDYYFKGAQKIIRKNRRSIAYLDGSENKQELEGLAHDVFLYFGLGCRNVSKLFLPKGYDLDILFQAFYTYSDIIKHNKYRNNYDYNKAIFLMGNNKLIENGFLLLKEEKSLYSPVSMLYYEYYVDRNTVDTFIKKNSKDLQCIVSKNDTPFGYTQTPNLWDYADGIDTIHFLNQL
tara:strand:- start:749 stop:1753 length:1005 start_codon:yes stop_codon:yes gene_type:complete